MSEDSLRALENALPCDAAEQSLANSLSNSLPEENGHDRDRPGEVLPIKQSIEALMHFSQLLSARFQLLNHTYEEDMQNAIRCLQLAMYLISGGDDAFPLLLDLLACSYIIRFFFFDDLTDVKKGIEYLSQAVRLTPDHHVAKPRRLADLGKIYLRRFVFHKELTGIDKAIECHSQAVLLTSDTHEDKPVWLENLGHAYEVRFQGRGELADLNKAIEYYSQAMVLTPNGHPDMLGRLTFLAYSYRSRFEFKGESETADREKANAYGLRTLRLSRRLKNDNKPNHLENPGNSSLARFWRLDRHTAVDHAIQWMGEGMRNTFHGNTDEPSILGFIGRKQLCRFEYLGELAGINAAIECYNRAVSLAPDDHARKPQCLDKLGDLYKARFRRQGDPADVDSAIECHIQALRLTPNCDASKRGSLCGLGSSYLDRFQCHSDLADINKAIESLSQAVQLTPDGHDAKPGYLNELGNAYEKRLEWRGELADGNKGIDCYTQAVLLTPEGDEHLPGYLGNLGNSYLRRFRNSDVLADIDKAIECMKRATHIPTFIPGHHGNKPNLLSNLGLSYIRRFQRCGNIEDINRAIQCASAAVRLTPEGDITMPPLLNTLGGSYLIRARSHSERVDIETAIKYQSQAVRLIPDGHSFKPVLLGDLGSSYLAFFQCHSDPNIINQAVELLGRALQLSPDGYVHKPGLLLSLGDAYMARYRHQKDLSDLTKALAFSKEGAVCVTGSPSMRFQAACQWANVSKYLNVSPLDACQRAIELVPELVWLGLTIHQRYELLPKIGGIAVQAAFCAISRQEYGRAIEWLEQGRSVVWNQMLQLRNPLDEISAVDPPLGEHLRVVASELDRGASGAFGSPLGDASMDPEKATQQYHRVANEWGQLLEKARQIPSFEDFMRPHKAELLMRTAQNGPIIVINVNQGQSDALFILPNNHEIKHLALERFSWEIAMELRLRLWHLIGHRGGRAGGFKRATSSQNREYLFKRMLTLLWSDVVKPVLEFLGYTRKPPANELPHVTWCITGPLSFLPLHAAGCYNGSEPNTFDLVVSSYAPTLSALLASKLPEPSQNSGILAIGLQHTRGQSDLPNTVTELAAIKRHAEGAQYMELDGENATVDAVLNAMNEYSCVHLACHATQNTADPTQSAFHLHDGKLSLATIMGQSFKNKGLAFLSACQTATGCEQLPDEAVHLAAGMLMAGYPSVIGTMWSIQDEDTPEVTNTVYAELLKDGRMNYAGAARALHKAMTGLREKVGENAFERWIPFLHIGR